MSDLRQALDDYLTIRRALGFSCAATTASSATSSAISSTRRHAR